MIINHNLNVINAHGNMTINNQLQVNSCESYLQHIESIELEMTHQV